MIDANILVAGTGWVRFPYEVVRHAVSGDYQLVLSPIVIEEARTHVLRLFPHAMKQLEAVLADSNYEKAPIISESDVVASLDLARDVKDVPIVLSAIKAQVDYFVTQDKDLTDPGEPIHQQLKVMLPGTFLREHMGWTSEQLEAIRNRTWEDLEN